MPEHDADFAALEPDQNRLFSWPQSLPFALGE
jgi:hypothetical protein